MFAETSFYEVILAAPAELKLASTGTVIGKETREAQTTWHIVSGPVREFAVALGRQFEVLESRQGDTILRLYPLPSRNPATSAGEGLDIFKEAFNYQIASTEDYLTLAEEVAGKQLDPIFTAWIRLAAGGSRK